MRLPGKRIDFDTESTEKQFHTADNCVPVDKACLMLSVSNSMRLPGKRIDFDTERRAKAPLGARLKARLLGPPTS